MRYNNIQATKNRPMEADKLIQAFTQVVRNQDFVFSPEAIATIPALRETIAEFETQSPQELAEAIRNWYINHEDVRDAVLIEEREIDKISKTKPEAQENTQENRYRVLQDELQKLEEKKTVAPQPKQS
ncbi:hypothetical protein [Nostoc sp.]|uniref:hypothetical protein n=1 Tax=Nostoc sp. TaxID=1180 RepID=UPI002FF4E48B